MTSHEDLTEEIKALKERCDRLESQVDMLMTKWVDLGKFAQSLKRVYYEK